MKVIHVRNAEVFECVGVNQSRKKLVLRISGTKYGGTNPLGFKFMPQDYRVLDDKGKGATNAEMAQLAQLKTDIDKLDKERIQIDAQVKVLSMKRRAIVERLPQIEVDTLPALKLLTREESSKLWNNEDAIPGSRYDARMYSATQLAEVPFESGDQSKA